MKLTPLISLLALMLVAGCGTPSFLVTPVSSSTELREEQVQPGQGWSPDKVVIIPVEGMLMNARAGGFLQATENKVSLFAQQLERAAADPKVKAVVLRINSPGGTVNASTTMYELVQTFKAKTKKPVVAVGQDVTASGSYLVAISADKIVAHPSSVVGSIGVIFQTFDASGTMNMIGLKADAIKSGAMKDMGSPFKPLTPAERELMQAMVNDFYAQFSGKVAERRSIPEADRATTMDGRVFTGTQAKERKLIDELGGVDDAINLARTLANAPKAQAVIYIRPYGYTGSVYANAEAPTPQTAEASTPTAELMSKFGPLPTGFYYLWRP
jgi:protease-4